MNPMAINSTGAITIAPTTTKRPGLGFLYVLCVPLGAGLANVTNVRIADCSYILFLSTYFLLAGVLHILAGQALCKHRAIYLRPHPVWLPWFGYVWLSLAWCDGIGVHNAKAALFISMPLLMATAGSMFVLSEAQLRSLMRSFGVALALMCLCTAAAFLGMLEIDSFATGPALNPRPMAIATVLIGCVFIAGGPRRSVVPIAGWSVCILLAASTSGRMATAALLLALVLHPLYGGLRRRIVALLASALLGIALFQTTAFQERFFDSGRGSLSQLFSGEISGEGRFYAWPLIWEEAWKHPILGKGVYSSARFVPTIWPNMQSPHNEYLRIGFEFGIVGLALFLGAAVWQIIDLRKQIKRSDGIVRSAFAASLLGLFMFLITGCTDNPLGYSLWYMNPLFALMGAAYGVAARARERRSEFPLTFQL